ncbi:MAG: hypothetical protein ACI9HE_000460 [Planctomycetota bacterium]
MADSLSLAPNRSMKFTKLPSQVRPLLLAGLAYGALVAGTSAVSAPVASSINATVRDFKLPGTQAHELNDLFPAGFTCGACHGGYDDTVAPYDLWTGTMMAQAGRDPIFYAALTIANQDVGEAGEFCLRCHAPGAWLEGRSTPADGSGLDNNVNDFDGVTCAMCHRMVDPIYDPSNPIDDVAILANLDHAPGPDAHTGMYVIDPDDNRRGPFDLGPSFGYHEWRESPFHRDSQMCGTCHDVSSPVLEKRVNGNGWKLSQYNQEHPTQVKADMFPIERTYSEWTQSVYAVTEIETGGRFGGDKPQVASCQDCHMPDVNATACLPGLGEIRPDMPLHTFLGVNSWVMRAIRATYPDFETGLTAQKVDDSIARNMDFVARSADLTAFMRDGELVVRVVNHSGHKLPTGYGEGRRMWIHVTYRDAGGNVVGEHGNYDLLTATLDSASTRVYEIEMGADNYLAAAAGILPGPNFHFTLSNKLYKDNRIPARGFTNAGYAAVGAQVLGATYADQQHWDDVTYALPIGAVSAEVELFHQTTTREYIEFLRDDNITDSRGQDAYDLWDMFGQSEPVLMDSAMADLALVDCTDAVPFGLGTLTSAGERPELAVTSSASVTGNLLFDVSGGLPGQLAILFSGDGTTSVPHFGGVRLITSPNRELVFTLDGNGQASIYLPLTPAQVGTGATYQVYFRDPGATSGVGMTNGVQVNFCD